MSVRATVVCTFGPPGAHKTYVRCAEFLIKWVRFERGTHYSNFPVDVDALAAYMLRKHKIPEATTRAKVHVFPREEFDRWRKAETVKRIDPSVEVRGPWHYFKELGLEDLSGCHVAIDEAHIVLPKSGQVNTRRQWGDWLAEIRHAGCTIEFISQHIDRVDEDVQRMAEERIEISNLERRVEPLFRIPMASWYELRAAFSGRYTPCVVESYQRKHLGKWTVEYERRYYPNPDKYVLYNSYSAGQSDASTGTAGNVQHKFQELGDWGTVKWFCQNYWFNLLRTGVLAVLLYHAIMIGVPWFLKGQREWFVGAMASQREDAQGGAGVFGQSRGMVASSVPGAVSDGPEVGEAAAVAFPLGETVATSEYLALEAEKVQAEAQVSDLKTMVDDQAEYIYSLEEARSGLVLLTPEKIVWLDGQETHIGETIEGTRYDGRELVVIDFEKRVAHLDDGSKLRLGGLRNNAAAGGRFADVGGLLQSRGEAGDGNEGGGDVGGTADAVGGRDAHDVVSPVPGPGDGDIYYRGIETGRSVGDDGNRESTGGGGFTGGGAAAGSRDSGPGRSLLRGETGTAGQSGTRPASWASGLRGDRAGHRGSSE